MYIDEANLSNLTKLWHKYGSQPVKATALPLLQANTGWPHRCWIDWNASQNKEVEQLQGDANDNRWLQNIPETAVLPLWSRMSANNSQSARKFETQVTELLLLDKHWYCNFEQTAMYLVLPSDVEHSPQTCTGFKVKSIDKLEDIKKWVDIGSEAFSYQIDFSVIQRLFNDEDIQLLIGWENDQAIACGLLYKTGDVIGIHQVGVKQAFQGKGFAKRFMLEVIAACEKWNGKYVVLQASQAGKPLYEKLGFKSQFLIKNFKRV